MKYSSPIEAFANRKRHELKYLHRFDLFWNKEIIYKIVKNGITTL